MAERDDTGAMAELQAWYARQCDGDWEHEHGVEIATLDNPGWRVQVSLEGTNLEGRTYERTAVQRNETDWAETWVAENCWHAACGPLSLDEVLAAFRRWVSS